MDRDELIEQLSAVKAGATEDAALLKDLKKRQLISLVCVLCQLAPSCLSRPMHLLTPSPRHPPLPT